jgi:hypothetical protein
VTLKDKILAADDLPRIPLVVPEWGISEEDGGFIRGLTGSGRDAYESGIRNYRNGQMVVNLKDVRARLVAMCLVDEDGNRVFSDKEIQALGAKSGQVLERLFDKAAALSGLSKETVEELAEGFGEAQSDEDGSV